MNLDVRNEMVDAAKSAIQNGDVDGFVNQMTNFVENAKNEVLKDYEELKDVQDKNILAQRGYFDLTANEKKFYDNVVKAASGWSLEDIDKVLPEETFDRIFDELVTEHPLLSHVNFINMKAIVGKILVNTGISGVAGWGELCATIDDEITSGFAFRALNQHKLSAYMEICKTLLDLGYMWIDRYTRMCLGEAIALALEDAIINGTGSSMPLGLTKEIADAGETQTIPAQDKDPITLTDLGAASLSQVAVTLSNSGKRPVGIMVMAVNPVDYYGKIIPATRIMNAEGKWVEYVPYPVVFVPCSAVEADSAVIFRDKAYTMAVGLGKEGRIDVADQYKFYEDLVCYKIKLVGDGTPNDNNAAVVADITNLKPAAMNVRVVEDEASV